MTLVVGFVSAIEQRCIGKSVAMMDHVQAGKDEAAFDFELTNTWAPVSGHDPEQIIGDGADIAFARARLPGPSGPERSGEPEPPLPPPPGSEHMPILIGVLVFAFLVAFATFAALLG